MGKGNSHNLGVRAGFVCLGHSNWTICCLLSQFILVNFPIFPLLYRGSNSYYPREGKAENGKREFSQPCHRSIRWVSILFNIYFVWISRTSWACCRELWNILGYVSLRGDAILEIARSRNALCSQRLSFQHVEYAGWYASPLSSSLSDNFDFLCSLLKSNSFSYLSIYLVYTAYQTRPFTTKVLKITSSALYALHFFRDALNEKRAMKS